MFVFVAQHQRRRLREIIFVCQCLRVLLSVTLQNVLMNH